MNTLKSALDAEKRRSTDLVFQLRERDRKLLSVETELQRSTRECAQAKVSVCVKMLSMSMLHAPT